MFLPWLVVATFLAAAVADNPSERPIPDINDPIYQDDGVNYRLPNDTHPETYDISLITRIDDADFEFSGLVKIGIVVNQPTRSVVLHTRELTVGYVSLARYSRIGEPDDLEILPYGYDLKTEFLNITTNGIDLLVGDRLLLEIHYVGTLAENLLGFYKSSYKNSDGTEKWLATTQFEPTSARHAFPCYDEPALKAKFTISITHSKDYHALSNMPEIRVEHSDDTATTLFPQTPLTSTYLIAFVVSDFPYKTNTNIPGVFRHRIYSQPSNIGSTELGLKDGERILNVIESYLQVNYSMPKLDQVAIPDFRAGAMENWGLVTYKEDRLLWNPQSDAFSVQYKVVKLISHELAHQWFGNLVSPLFWQYIWLNEGFATLFEHIGTNAIYPEWKTFQLFVTQKLQCVLTADALPATRPMTFYAQSPEAIQKIFDSIAYEKSASVLYMFMHAFTESSFKKSLRYYLIAHAYKAVDDRDLFDVLEKAVREDDTLDAEFNVHDIFSSWSNQPGYPLITVERYYDTTSDTITLHQHHYMSARTLDNDTTTWWVPFNYATSKSPDFSDTRATGWIRQNEVSHSLSVSLSPSDWIVLNKQQTSLYRVLYDERNYLLIAYHLRSGKTDDIHVLSRSQLLDDLNEFVNVGRVKVNILFEFLAYLKHETEYAPWKSATPAILRLELVLGGTKQYRPFISFVRKLTEKYYESTGIEDLPDDPIINKYSREQALFLACSFGLQACLDATHSKLAQSLQENSPLPPSTAVNIYIQGARTATKSELELLWKRLFESTNVDECRAIAIGLGSSNNRPILRSFLDRTLQSYPKEPLDLSWRENMFRQALQNGPRILETCLSFIRNSAQDINKFFRKEKVADFVLLISSRNMDKYARMELEDILDHLVNGGHISDADAAAARENLKAYAISFNKYKETIQHWFASAGESAIRIGNRDEGFLGGINV